jgi:RNAse (barnase) inhibitor barstar
MADTHHLQSTRSPYVELLPLKDGETYDSALTVPRGFAVKVFHGHKCRTKSALLGEFSRVLEFPSYFAKNWDAFVDCLTDLQWLPAPGYVFVILDAEDVLAEHDQDYAIFIDILNEAGRVWGTEQDVRPEIPFHVVLVIADRDKSKRKWGIPLFRK